jgi:hypothetical protein
MAEKGRQPDKITNNNMNNIEGDKLIKQVDDLYSELHLLFKERSIDPHVVYLCACRLVCRFAKIVCEEEDE